MTELHGMSKEDKLHAIITYLESGTIRMSCRLQACADRMYRSVCKFSFISYFVHYLIRKAEILCFLTFFFNGMCDF
jgi:hypothetical protein